VTARRALAATLALLALGSCAPYPLTPAKPAPSAPAPPAAAPAPPPRSPIRQPDVDVRDACGAADMQRLVGRPRSEIPVPLDPNRQRVACTTCPLTQDYRPDRLNFFFDAASGIIRQVRCG
jgi:hypothetical protein